LRWRALWTLDEIVYLTLIALLPLVDPAARRVCTAEEQVERLSEQRHMSRHMLKQKNAAAYVVARAAARALTAEI
jgi:hypothetical protein